jgi:hypothetical protein
MWPFDDEEEEGALPQTAAPALEDNQQNLGGLSSSSGAPAAPKAGSLKDLLMQKYAAAGDPTALNEAKDSATKAHMALAIGQAAENWARAPIIARGGAGANPSAYNHMGSMIDNKVAQASQARQQAQQNVLGQHTLGKQLDQEQIASDENDPASEKSKGFRDYLKKLYPDQPIPDSFSYAEGQKSLGPIAAKFAADQTKRDIAQNKLDAMDGQRKELAERRRQFDLSRSDRAKDAAASRDQAKSDKDFMAMGKDLEEGTASSRSDLGRHAQTVSAADKLLTLGKQGAKQPGGLDSRQIEEAAVASAALVGGGNGPAQSTVQALVPHNMASSAAGIKEWLMSEPQGADQQAFVARMMETAEREKQLATEKIKGIKGSVLQKYAHLKDRDPSRWADTMAYHFGDDAKFDKNGRYVSQEFKEKAEGPKGDGATAYAGVGDAAPNAALHPQASAAKDWANANLMSPDPDTATKARAILERLK